MCHVGLVCWHVREDGEFTGATQDQPAPTFSFPQMRRLHQNPQACRLDSCQSETRFERLVHLVFIADIGWDERQGVNGFTEFRGHASRSNTKQIQMMAAEIYGTRSNGQDFADRLGGGRAQDKTGTILASQSNFLFNDRRTFL
ncbi:MAG: hypothetical protein WCC90_08390 [Methylocella sp.]